MTISETAIINSQVFKFVNRQIDSKMAYLNSLGKYLTDNNPFLVGTMKDHIYTRTHEEGGTYVETVVNIGAISQVRYYMDEYEKTKREISDLMSQKCTLLNDWDYTKGDDTAQKEVFGDKID